MKLFYSPASPYVRKVLVTAIELGLDASIERVAASPHPINRDASILPANPLGKIPTLIDDDGTVVYDSRVICEYLDAKAGGGRIVAASGADRWTALVQQALCDGLLDAALLIRYENTARQDTPPYAPWVAGQTQKMVDALDQLEATAKTLGDRMTTGTIAIGCALGYLDLRFADMRWRDERPNLTAWFAVFAQKPSMQATAPK